MIGYKGRIHQRLFPKNRVYTLTQHIYTNQKPNRLNSAWRLRINKDTVTGNEGNREWERESHWYFLTFSKLANSSIHLADTSMEAVAIWVCVSHRPDKGWWWDSLGLLQRKSQPTCQSTGKHRHRMISERCTPLPVALWARLLMFLAPLGPVCRPGMPADLFPVWTAVTQRGAPWGKAEGEKDGVWGGSKVEGWDQSVALRSHFTQDTHTCPHQPETVQKIKC